MPVSPREEKYGILVLGEGERADWLGGEARGGEITSYELQITK